MYLSGARNSPVIKKKETTKYIDHQDNRNLYQTTHMDVKEQITATNSNSSSGSKNDTAEVGVGQGQLYSPDHAIKLNANGTNKQLGGRGEEIRKETMVLGVGADIRRNLGTIKEKVLEKLAVASVPADALENARHFIESVIRDVSVAAHGLTKDALLRIKTHLVDLLPSLSPNITRKMVDDAEKEANGHTESSDGEEEIEESQGQNQDEGGSSSSSKAAPYLSPASSLFSSLVKPLSSRL